MSSVLIERWPCLFSGIAVVVSWLQFMRYRLIADDLRAQMLARERTATVLHDTLIQGVQGMILLLQVIANELPTGHEKRRRLEDALDQAERMLEEARSRMNEPFREHRPNGPRWRDWLRRRRD